MPPRIRGAPKRKRQEPPPTTTREKIITEWLLGFLTLRDSKLKGYRGAKKDLAKASVFEAPYWASITVRSAASRGTRARR